MLEIVSNRQGVMVATVYFHFNSYFLLSYTHSFSLVCPFFIFKVVDDNPDYQTDRPCY